MGQVDLWSGLGGGGQGGGAVGGESSQLFIKWGNLPYWLNVAPKQTLYDHDWEWSQLFLQTEVSAAWRGNNHKGQNKQDQTGPHWEGRGKSKSTGIWGPINQSIGLWILVSLRGHSAYRNIHIQIGLYSAVVRVIWKNTHLNKHVYKIFLSDWHSPGNIFFLWTFSFFWREEKW